MNIVDPITLSKRQSAANQAADEFLRKSGYADLDQEEADKFLALGKNVEKHVGRPLVYTAKDYKEFMEAKINGEQLELDLDFMISLSLGEFLNSDFLKNAV